MRGVDLARRLSSSTDEVTSFPDRLLNVEEAADLLKLKPATLYQWAYERRIPIVNPSGPRGPLRFRLSTLMKLIDTWSSPPSARSPNAIDTDTRRPVPCRSECPTTTTAEAAM